ncbi:winged helix-turn-helix domain-containing protein [Lutispora thermophila]|uniref:Mrr N-terminal domain-containing protein n=1 Tax=Lutispora thermophila DSM 19022 TaxID=1122184 RepID=A0A1M6H0L1_9FIRM|nr:winged helix-turn-helix domain-containing protein [Lutispora thermophila]SHJ15757.1 Mrr N-terminal domain-containing protein [Lutispora thermophila DSM 19022]
MAPKKIAEGDTISIRFPLNVDKEVLEWVNAQTSINNSLISLIKKEINSNGITDLSQNNDSSLPTEKEMIPYVFQYIAKPKDSKLGANVQEIYEYCANALNISSNQRNIPSKANISRYENRVRFVILKLKNQGLIESPKRGFYKLTELGKLFINNSFDVREFDAIMQAGFIKKLINGEIKYPDKTSD